MVWFLLFWPEGAFINFSEEAFTDFTNRYLLDVKP